MTAVSSLDTEFGDYETCSMFRYGKNRILV
jgi:hypothetical protein